MQQFTVRLRSVCSISSCQLKTRTQNAFSGTIYATVPRDFFYAPLPHFQTRTALPFPAASPGTCCCNSTSSCKPRARPPPLPSPPQATARPPPTAPLQRGCLRSARARHVALRGGGGTGKMSTGGNRRGCGGRGRDSAVRYPLRHDIRQTSPAYGRARGGCCRLPPPHRGSGERCAAAAAAAMGSSGPAELVGPAAPRRDRAPPRRHL